MLRCLSPEQFDEMLDGRMSAVDLEVGAAHLDACARCRQQFIDHTQVADAQEWREAALESPPLGASEQALLEQAKQAVNRPLDGRAGRAIDYEDLLQGHSIPFPSLPTFPQPHAAKRSAQLPDIPGFEIIGELGRGGMGVVYKARQRAHDRTVALKMILAGHQASPEDLGRFHDEAEAISRLRHPHIVQIFEVGQHDGRLYFVLEFVEGGTLADKVRGQALPPRPAAQLLESLARAMHYAHQRGIIHRDLKPANVLLHRRQAFIDVPDLDTDQLPQDWDFRRYMPKITDFGLAKLLDRTTGNGHTASGDVVGTPSYMAPEQAQGKPHAIGPATDVYSLGAILYEMLTGRPPFQGATPMDTLFQVHTQDPIPPRKINRNIPPALETIALKCLRKDPSARYKSAEDLAEDLRLFLEGQPIQTRGIRPLGRSLFGFPQKAAGWLFAGGIVLLALAAGGGLVWLWMQGESQKTELQGVRDNNVAVVRENLLLRIELARNTCNQGPLAQGLFDLAALLQEPPPGDEVAELTESIRLNLDAWGQHLPELRWISPQPARAAVFNTDGREIWLSTEDRRLLRASPDSSPRPADLPEAGGAQELAVAPNGSTLAAVTPSGLRWWDLNGGSLMYHKANLAKPRGLTLSPDGSTLLLKADENGPNLWMFIWNPVGRLARMERLPVPANASTWAWHPKGDSVLVGCDDGSVHVVPTAGAKSVLKLVTVPAAVTDVAWINDGLTAAIACADGSVYFENLSEATVAEPSTLRAHPPGRVQIAAGRGWIVTAGSDRQVKLWRSDRGQLVTLLPHESPVEQVAITTEGTSFLTRNNSGIVRVFSMPQDGRGLALRFDGLLHRRPRLGSEGRSLVAVVHEAPSRVLKWDLTGLSPTPTQLLPESGQSFQFAAAHPRQELAVVGVEFASHGLLQIWDLKRDRRLHSIKLNRGLLTAAAFHNDGKLVLTGTSAGEATSWDLASGQPTGLTLSHPGEIRAAAYGRDGQAVLLGGRDNGPGGEARVWSLSEAPQPLSPPLPHPAPVIAVAWEAGGTVVRTVDEKYHVRRWDIATGQRLDPPAPVPSNAAVVAYNAAGDRCVFLGDDGMPRLLVSGGRIQMLREHGGDFKLAQFSDDGQLLLTARSSGVQLWDAKSGVAIGPVLELNELQGAEFSGRFVLAWSRCEARRWPLPSLLPADGAEWQSWLRRRTGLERTSDGFLRPLDAKHWAETARGESP